MVKGGGRDFWKMIDVNARLDLNDPKVLKAYKKAAAAESARTTKTEASARRALKKDGILTKSGNISAKYR